MSTVPELISTSTGNELLPMYGSPFDGFGTSYSSASDVTSPATSPTLSAPGPCDAPAPLPPPLPGTAPGASAGFWNTRVSPWTQSALVSQLI